MDDKPSVSPLTGVAVGAAIGSAAIAAALMFAGRLKNPFVDRPELRPRRRAPELTAVIPAAFAADGPPQSGPNCVRDAGPDNVRDQEDGRDWDRADEASDESFPASDPPSSY